MPFLDGKPVIITKRNTDKHGNPISVKQIETKQVVDIHNSIPLNYSIDRNHPIVINGMHQIYNKDEISENTFYADYDQGILYFHPTHVSKSITITYMGTGYILISSDRIYRYNKGDGTSATESIEASFEKLENILNTIIKNGGGCDQIVAEVIGSRTDAQGQTFPSLGDRLNYITTQLDNLTTIVRYKRLLKVNTDVTTVTVGIAEYNPKSDTLSVYLSGVRMIEGEDYSLDENNRAITCLKGQWNIGDELYFEVLQRSTDSTPPGGGGSLPTSIDASNVVLNNPVFGANNAQDAFIQIDILLKDKVDKKDFNDLTNNFNLLNQEVIDARTDKNGVVNNNLKERLDKVDSHLENIAPHLTQWVNVKTYGAKGDGITDDTDIIQYCLNNFNVIYIPGGTYIITKQLIMPFNRIIIGDNVQDTIFKSNIVNDYIIKYGESYNYNGYRGHIKSIKFKSENSINQKPFGVYANSGILIEKCDFYGIGKIFDRASDYIDMIKFDSVYCGYCVPNGDYLIKISGNTDALEINQLKFAMYERDTTEFNGIYISRCHGGQISNSIPNCYITFDNVNAFSINNSHIEGLENYIIVKDSHVSFNDSFKFKNSLNHDVQISSSNYDKTSSVSFNNFNFYMTGERVNRFDKCVEEIAPITINTILTFNNCFRTENFADKNRTTMNVNGILIKNFEEFNMNSNEFSVSSYIQANNINKTIATKETNYNVSLGSASITNIVNWKNVIQPILYYRALTVIDEERKIITAYSKYVTVSDVSSNGVSIALSGEMVGNEGILYLFRGVDNTNYTEFCKIPVVSRCILVDNGLSVNGFPWESVNGGSVTNKYNKPTSYKKIGNNVIVEMSSAPTLGLWQKGDEVINTNIAIGQNIGWKYNGVAWISYGQYN